MTKPNRATPGGRNRRILATGRSSGCTAGCAYGSRHERGAWHRSALTGLGRIAARVVIEHAGGDRREVRITAGDEVGSA